MPFVYEDRIVAYIDILAFADKIKLTENEVKPVEAAQMLNSLTSSVRFLQKRISKSIQDSELPTGTLASMFSDTIVISIPKAESNGALHLFEILKELQIQSIEKNILLRGGIVHGNLVHRDQLIIGPALINAYNVESKSALYPRIVIDPRVLSLFVRENGAPIKDFKIRDYDFHLTWSDDFDGTSFIDYFNSVDEYIPDGNTKKYFEILNEMINKGIRYQKDTGIRMKYMWMRKKLELANYPDDTKYPKHKKH